MLRDDFARGSEWRRWDLHIHTPASYHSEFGDDWDLFVTKLKEKCVEHETVIAGINDYFSVEGYKRLVDDYCHLKQDQPYIQVDDQHKLYLIPCVELRLEIFDHDNDAINLHLFFDPIILADTIRSSFLEKLPIKYRDKRLHCKHDDLVKIGHTELRNGQYNENLDIAGLNATEKNQCVKRALSLITLESSDLERCLRELETILEKSGLEKRCYVKAIAYKGHGSLSGFKWYGHGMFLGRAGNSRSTLLSYADICFTNDKNDRDFLLGKTKATPLAEIIARFRTVKPCVWGSDAHSVDNLFFPSNGHSRDYTWIKADPSFKGLLQVLNEPTDRVYIGEVPNKVNRVQQNKTKYINAVTISKKVGTDISEIWFDNTIPLSYDLSAIIGNKGKGKSALTDIIGLLCNTRQHAEFTFLSNENFRQPKENKARHFQATLKWESGVAVTKGLEEQVDDRQPEQVKYIPQNFLEKICTQLGNIAESDFDKELKKVIFSHVDVVDRLGRASLDELIGYKTSEANTRFQILKQELGLINKIVVSLEEKSEVEYRETLQNLRTLKMQELVIHEASRPALVSKPDGDTGGESATAKALAEIETAKKELLDCEQQIAGRTVEQSALVQHIATVDRLFARLQNLERQISSFIAESRQDFDSIGLPLEGVLQVVVDKKPLEERRKALFGDKQNLDVLLDPTSETSLVKKMVQVEESIEGLQRNLDEPNQRYQASVTAIMAWERKRDEIKGSAKTANSLSYYEHQLNDLDNVPQQLHSAWNDRMSKAIEIHSVIRELANSYRELYAPVNQFIETSTLAKEKFHLNFEVEILNHSFQAQFFDFITHGSAGTFCGIEEGNKMLRSIIAKHDFNAEVGVKAFLAEIVGSLNKDKRLNDKPVRIVDQIKKGKDLQQLYDYVFSLGYLVPRYALRMGDKELQQLSPGERGSLLLVFYLLVDKDDIPLIIDQPEENLDNQTVYELLVPCMKEAKQRRQILIVTHNPNLAVVCDAEQVIWADLDKKDNYRMRYLSGSIENPEINKAIVDVLEGTMPAFENRDSKYHE